MRGNQNRLPEFRPDGRRVKQENSKVRRRIRPCCALTKRASAPRVVKEEHIHWFEQGRRWIESPLSAGQRNQQCRATTKTERSGGVVCEEEARGEMTRTDAPTSGLQRRRFIPITAPGTFRAALAQLIYCPKSNQINITAEPRRR